MGGVLMELLPVYGKMEIRFPKLLHQSNLKKLLQGKTSRNDELFHVKGLPITVERV
jgi:hypothetical protein